MTLETYSSGKRDEIHTDVLLKARQACYKARDAFYTCLDKQSDKKPTEIGSAGLLYPIECKKSRDEFVKNCRASWVAHLIGSIVRPRVCRGCLMTGKRGEVRCHFHGEVFSALAFRVFGMYRSTSVVRLSQI